jgi:hypothetical protein
MSQIVKSYVLDVAEKRIQSRGGFDHMVAEIIHKGVDPYTLVEKMFRNGNFEEIESN